MNDERTHEAERRTSLAVERTQLAWWRTGLTALAVAVGVGRVLPELSDADTTWPYAVVGIVFALYGIGLFVMGNVRGPAGWPGRAGPLAMTSVLELALVLAGPLLGVVVIAMIALAG